SDAPPQTLAQRLIWYVRAQLALAQGKPDRMLAITEQLFASAAHVAGEQSIPHLAHLRGEALAMLKSASRGRDCTASRTSGSSHTRPTTAAVAHRHRPREPVRGPAASRGGGTCPCPR